MNESTSQPEVAGSRGEAGDDVARRVPRLVVDVAAGGRLRVRVSGYVKEWVERMSRFPERHWRGAERAWVLPDTPEIRERLRLEFLDLRIVIPGGPGAAAEPRGESLEPACPPAPPSQAGRPGEPRRAPPPTPDLAPVSRPDPSPAPAPDPLPAPASYLAHAPLPYPSPAPASYLAPAPLPDPSPAPASYLAPVSRTDPHSRRPESGGRDTRPTAPCSGNGRNWPTEPEQGDRQSRAAASAPIARPARDPVVRRVISPEDLEALAEFERRLRLRGRSARTCKAYIHHIGAFARHPGANLRSFGEAEIRSYLLSLLDRNRTHVYVNQAVSAIKAYCVEILERPDLVPKVPRPRPMRTLPTVLSREELLRMLGAMPNLKHRTIVIVAYSAGLRVGEVVRLRIEDLDIGRGMLHVRQGKGGKDRCSLLGAAALEAIRAYREWFPGATGWLFPGGRPGTHLTERSVQKVVEHAAKAAGLGAKRITPHTLRHSFATHLIEDGTNLLHVQKLLGHRRPETTQRYTRVTRTDLARIRSPLDNIYDTLRKPASLRHRRALEPPLDAATLELQGMREPGQAGGVENQITIQRNGRRYRIIRTRGIKN
ncbi:MAG: tyrosine-type recombinase/integrase [Candidatus Sericytochromatia bacterium]|nr:tyrosine-type recombinase/integrase [Candidatus Tanganyikabacteria bacterium]